MTFFWAIFGPKKGGAIIRKKIFFENIPTPLDILYVTSLREHFFSHNPPRTARGVTNFPKLPWDWQKWRKMAEKWRFFSFFTYCYPNIVYFSLLDVQNLKSIGDLKLDLYGLLYFHTFNIRKSRAENAKCEKEQFIHKKWKSFCSIDLKVYKHLHTYKTHIHTKFGCNLNCILGGFSGILYNLEMFWSHGRIRLLWKTPKSCKIQTSYPIAPI